MNDKYFRENEWWVSPYNFVPEVRNTYQLPKSVSIHDATLRDGEQTPGVVMSVKEKIEIAEKLERTLLRAAMQDLLAGQIQLMFDNMASALPQVKGGKIRALAVTTPRRSIYAPELPTIAESGLPGFDVSTWFGLFAPANTPKEAVARLHDEFVRALALPDVKEKLANLGIEPVGNKPEEFAAYIKTEAAKYGDVIRKSGAKVD